MIEVTFNTALLLYLILTLSILLTLWTVNHYQVRNKTIVPCDERLMVCEFCHFVYLDRSFKKIHQCPQCHLYSQIQGE